MQSFNKGTIDETTPELCYQIYLNDMSRVHSLIKTGVQATNELNSLNAYYASLSMSIDEKINVISEILEDEACKIFKFITSRFTEDDFERAIQFEYDFGKSLPNYISFIEHQYSILNNLNDDTIGSIGFLIGMMEDDILSLADEEGMGEQSAGRLLLKYENKKTKIVCFGDR